MQMLLQSYGYRCRFGCKAVYIDADVVVKLCVKVQMRLQSCVYRWRCGCKAVRKDADVVTKLCVTMWVA